MHTGWGPQRHATPPGCPGQEIEDVIFGVVGRGGVLVAVVGGGWPPAFGAWQPSDWTALAAGVTAITAVVAGTIALLQLRHARALRREQAQPYVAAFMEPTEADPHLVDLVLRNFGTTVARDVRITAVPPLRRTGRRGDDPEDVWLPEHIPALVPGQEWRTLWDSSAERAGSDLPDRHDVTISYRDSHNRTLPDTPSALDWAAYRGRRWLGTYGIHHAAKALREIDKTTKKWTDTRGNLAVRARDGDAADERERASFAAFIAQGDTAPEQAGPPPDPGSPT